MRRLALLLAASSALAASAACTRKNELPTLPSTDTDVSGTFTLQSAGNQVVPYVAVVTQTQDWQLTNDRMIIAANGTWVDTTSYQVTSVIDGSQSGQQTASAGTYTIANGQINFVMTSAGNVLFAGSVTGNRLFVLFNGTSYLYTR